MSAEKARSLGLSSRTADQYCWSALADQPILLAKLSSVCHQPRNIKPHLLPTSIFEDKSQQAAPKSCILELVSARPREEVGAGR